MVVSSIYPENVWVKVGKRASSLMGITEAEFFTGVGTSFVQVSMSQTLTIHKKKALYI